MATNTKPLISQGDLADIINKSTSHYLGSEAPVETDLSNLVDVGRKYEALPSEQRRAITSQMVTLVTQQITDVRVYNSSTIDIVRSRAPYDQAIGGIIQKNRPALLDAVSDADVYNPEPDSTNDPFKNYPIASETDYYANSFQWRYQWSLPERWFSGLFLHDSALQSFLSGVEQQVRNSQALNVESLTMSALRASIARNINSVADLKVGGVRAVNLLADYRKSNPNSQLTAAGALTDPQFMRYAVYRIWSTLDGVTGGASPLYNERGFVQHSSADDLQIVMLSQFKRGFEQFLLSDVFHDDYLSLPQASTVNYWKSPTTTKGGIPDFTAASSINEKIITTGTTKKAVKTGGVVAHVFDREHLGIYNLGTKETSMYDPVGLKENRFLHVAGQSIVDPYHNSVTFYIADITDAD